MIVTANQDVRGKNRGMRVDKGEEEIIQPKEQSQHPNHSSVMTTEVGRYVLK